ncbi:MAG TPA: hypothetical protein VFF65_08880 [Phycisphaerales bacterium]|nr:hypothetical protein [Phycisphaerales bacterium]
MPRTVTGRQGSMTFSNRSWGMLMKLAYDSGWKPLGCEQPERWPVLTGEGDLNRFFSMDYFSRLGQRVTAEDAARIADAIESALPDIPAFDAMAHKVLSSIDAPGLPRPLRSIRPGVKVNPYEYFSGDNREPLGLFIRFCRAGGFAIT